MQGIDGTFTERFNAIWEAELSRTLRHQPPVPEQTVALANELAGKRLAEFLERCPAANHAQPVELTDAPVGQNLPWTLDQLTGLLSERTLLSYSTYKINNELEALDVLPELLGAMALQASGQSLDSLQVVSTRNAASAEIEHLRGDGLHMLRSMRDRAEAGYWPAVEDKNEVFFLERESGVAITDTDAIDTIVKRLDR